MNVLCWPRNRGGGPLLFPILLSGLAEFVVVFEETASGLHKDSSFCFTCLFNTLARGSPYPETR